MVTELIEWLRNEEQYTQVSIIDSEGNEVAGDAHVNSEMTIIVDGTQYQITIEYQTVEVFEGTTVQEYVKFLIDQEFTYVAIKDLNDTDVTGDTVIQEGYIVILDGEAYLIEVLDVIPPDHGVDSDEDGYYDFLVTDGFTASSVAAHFDGLAIRYVGEDGLEIEIEDHIELADGQGFIVYNANGTVTLYEIVPEPPTNGETPPTDENGEKPFDELEVLTGMTLQELKDEILADGATEVLYFDSEGSQITDLTAVVEDGIVIEVEGVTMQLKVVDELTPPVEYVIEYTSETTTGELLQSIIDQGASYVAIFDAEGNEVAGDVPLQEGYILHIDGFNYTVSFQDEEPPVELPIMEVEMGPKNLTVGFLLTGFQNGGQFTEFSMLNSDRTEVAETDLVTDGMILILDGTEYSVVLEYRTKVVEEGKTVAEWIAELVEDGANDVTVYNQEDVEVTGDSEPVGGYIIVIDGVDYLVDVVSPEEPPVVYEVLDLGFTLQAFKDVQLGDGATEVIFYDSEGNEVTDLTGVLTDGLLVEIEGVLHVIQLVDELSPTPDTPTNPPGDENGEDNPNPPTDEDEEDTPTPPRDEDDDDDEKESPTTPPSDNENDDQPTTPEQPGDSEPKDPQPEPTPEEKQKELEEIKEEASKAKEEALKEISTPVEAEKKLEDLTKSIEEAKAKGEKLVKEQVATALGQVEAIVEKLKESNSYTSVIEGVSEVVKSLNGVVDEEVIITVVKNNITSSASVEKIIETLKAQEVDTKVLEKVVEELRETENEISSYSKQMKELKGQKQYATVLKEMTNAVNYLSEKGVHKLTIRAFVKENINSSNSLRKIIEDLSGIGVDTSELETLLEGYVKAGK